MHPIDQIKDLFRALNQLEQVSLLKELSDSMQDETEEYKDDVIVKCPFCQSQQTVKNGRINGKQKYKCKDCHKSYSKYTGTIAHGIKKRNKFEEYKSVLLTEGLFPLKNMATRIGISEQTAFDWRHKILCTLTTDDTQFNGIVEIDDLWFLYSQKGRQGLKYSRKRGGSKHKGDNNYQAKLLVTSDREGTHDLSLTRIGRLKSEDIQRKVGGRFKKEVTLVSDKHSSISAFAWKNGINHVSFKSSQHGADKEHHVQLVNNMASRLKNFINGTLKGVSTKHLQCYANWFSFKEGKKGKGEILDAANQQLDQKTESWNTFINIESMYKKFIEEYSVRTYRCPTKRKWKNQPWNDDMITAMSYV